MVIKHRKEDSKANVKIYEYLRDKIVNLTLVPGEEISIVKLTEELGFSRSPIRDALLKLEEYRLIDIFPQSGTRVSLLNISSITQERFMRMNLELGALRECINKKRTTQEREAFVTKLRSLLLAQHAALLGQNYLEFFNTDDEMHRLFYKEAGLNEVWNVLSAHTGNERRIRILSYKAEGIADTVEKEHGALVDYIANGDIEGAINADRHHLERLSDELIILRNSFPHYFEGNN